MAWKLLTEDAIRSFATGVLPVSTGNTGCAFRPATNQTMGSIFMNQFAKKLLAASVLASLGSAAAAADKVPTLGEVLKASGIEVNGYIDASYTYLSTDQGSNSYHAYTNDRRSFNLQALDVAVSYLPASGFGGMAELQLGNDADFNGAQGASKRDNVDLLQGYIQYATGGLSVLGGKFTTLAGAEVAQAPNNTNFSRSLLYTNAIPVTHTGVRANYVFSDAFKLTAGINNGWDILKESGATDGVASTNCVSTTGPCADGKTLEMGVAATPFKLLSLNASYYTGEEYSGTSTQFGDRNLLDVVATFNLTDALSVVFNYDRAEQEKATAAAGKAKWNGLAGYVNYKFSDTWRLSVRGEKFEDKNCFKVSCTLGTGSTATAPSSLDIKEATVTVGYAPAKNAELRFEVRKDSASAEVYSDGGKPSKKQDFVGVEAVYKF
jgi:hypothetical protein